MRGAKLGQGFVVLRLRLLERDLIVAGIQLNKQRSGLDSLIVVYVNGLDGAVDAAAIGFRWPSTWASSVLS